MLDRLRAYVLIGTWAVGLGVLGPPCILLTILTKYEGFITYPAAAVIWVGYKLVGVRFTIVGRERVDPNGVYVYTPNHQSLIDAAYVWSKLGTARRRIAFLVKKELTRVPILGFGILQIGIVPVDRGDSHRAVATAREATERLRGGRSFVVFAEGTRTRDGRVLPFKKGAFHMAVDAGVPVVPVSLDGAFDAMPPGTLRLRRVPVRLTIHEPIPTAGMTSDDVPALADRVRAVVASAVAAGIGDRVGPADPAQIDSPGTRPI